MSKETFDFSKLAGDIDGTMLEIAEKLENTFIGGHGGSLLGAAAAIAIMETICIRWRQYCDVSLEDRPELWTQFEDAVADLRSDLLKRVFITTTGKGTA